MVLAEWKQKAHKILEGLGQRTGGDLVGLDIAPESLKVLKLIQTNSRYQVENFAIYPLPAGVIVKDEIKDIYAVVNGIKDVLKQADISSKQVAIAIPRLASIIKTVTIDSRLKPDEIESRAWIEANRLFPDLIGNIYLDFTVSGPSAQDSSQLELILVACRKDQLKPYLEILEQAGLKAKRVDVNCYALERAMQLVVKPAFRQNPIALLNLTINLSTLIVIHNQKLIHAHDQSYDGQRLLTQTHAYLKDKFGSAEVATHDIEQQLVDDAKYNDILKENLISHLRHTLHFFYSSRPNVGIQQILLAGDCATVPNLSLFMQREIGIETSIANPFVNMTIAPSVDEKVLKTKAPMLMLCCGLALSDFLITEPA